MLIGFMPNMDENDKRVAYDEMINSPLYGVLAILILVNGDGRGVQGKPIIRLMRGGRHFAKPLRILVPQPLECNPIFWFVKRAVGWGKEEQHEGSKLRRR